MKESEIYQLEKSIWTNEDFSQMGWHDCLLYGFAFVVKDEDEPWKNELYFDIDYIFKWVQPEPPSSFFTFWISPCTLIFENINDLKIEIDMCSIFQIQIMELKREIFKIGPNDLTYYNWELELENGTITLNSESFKQIVRKPPIYSKSQWLDINQRGGISFDKTACDII